MPLQWSIKCTYSAGVLCALWNWVLYTYPVGKCSSMTVSVQPISIGGYCQREVIKAKNELARPCLCFELRKSLVIRSSAGGKEFVVILHPQNSFSGSCSWDWHCISVPNKIFKDPRPLHIDKGFSYSNVAQIAFIDFLKNISGQILPSLTNVQPRGMPLRL